jgi:hypothetical protein
LEKPKHKNNIKIKEEDYKKNDFYLFADLRQVFC